MKIKPKLKIGARDINDNFCNDCKFKIKRRKENFVCFLIKFLNYMILFIFIYAVENV